MRTILKTEGCATMRLFFGLFSTIRLFLIQRCSAHVINEGGLPALALQKCSIYVGLSSYFLAFFVPEQKKNQKLFQTERIFITGNKIM